MRVPKREHNACDPAAASAPPDCGGARAGGCKKQPPATPASPKGGRKQDLILDSLDAYERN